MRLIDADVLEAEIKRLQVILTGLRAGKGVLNEYAKQYRESQSQTIDEQPTAYSVDKVVEELESFAKLAEDRWTNGTSKYAYQEHKCWVKAIEIVKQSSMGKDVE